MKADSDNSEELSDVLNMFVPYRYNEKNEIKDDVKKEVKDKVKYNTVDIATKS